MVFENLLKVGRRRGTGYLAEVLHVCACAKSAARAGEDDGTYCIVGLRLSDCGPNLLLHLPCPGVEFVRPV